MLPQTGPRAPEMSEDVPLWASAGVSACFFPRSPPKTALVKIEFSFAHHLCPRLLEPKESAQGRSLTGGACLRVRIARGQRRLAGLPPGRAGGLSPPKLTSGLLGCLGDPRTDEAGPGADVLDLVLM